MSLNDVFNVDNETVDTLHKKLIERENSLKREVERFFNKIPINYEQCLQAYFRTRIKYKKVGYCYELK